jgi:hypothetical protein
MCIDAAAGWLQQDEKTGLGTLGAAAVASFVAAMFLCW